MEYFASCVSMALVFHRRPDTLSLPHSKFPWIFSVPGPVSLFPVFRHRYISTSLTYVSFPYVPCPLSLCPYVSTSLGPSSTPSPQRFPAFRDYPE